MSRQDYDAILLLAHGTPDVLGEMAEYLGKVTGGRKLPDQVVHELQHRYGEIGLGETPGVEPPPLTKWTLQQGALLGKRLATPVYVGMRNWHPYIADVVAQMRADGVRRFKAICLAPQYSRTSVGLYRKAALEAANALKLEMDFIAGWSANPVLAHAFADRLWPAWAKACAVIGQRVPVLFTAHSVPCRTIMSGTVSNSASPSARPGEAVPAEGIQNYGTRTAPDPYPVECKNTARAIAAALVPVGMTQSARGKRGSDWYFAFQSQGVAGAPWIGPSVEDTLKSLANEGVKGVVLQPVGFLCDHVEILYDIDIAFKQTAVELGMQLWRAESLNDSPLLIDALTQVATGAFAAEIDEPAEPALAAV